MATTYEVSSAGLVAPTAVSGAVYHNGKTYLAYLASDRYVCITCYDHSTLAWASPVQLMDWTTSYDDSHNRPTLAFTTDGHIVVACAGHSAALYTWRSINPEDITAWNTPITVESAEATYACIYTLTNGNIVVFYRMRGATTFDWFYRTSSDGGASWSPSTKIIGSTGGLTGGQPYPFMAQLHGTDEFHIVEYEYAASGYKFYHAYTTDFSTWRKTDGTAISVPFDISTMTEAYGTVGLHGAPDVFVSSTGTVRVITKLAGEGYAMLRLDAGTWTHEHLGVTTPGWAGNVIDRTDADIVYLSVGTVAVAPSIGDNTYQIWKRSGAGVWAKYADVDTRTEADAWFDCWGMGVIDPHDGLTCFFSRFTTYSSSGGGTVSSLQAVFNTAYDFDVLLSGTYDFDVLLSEVSTWHRRRYAVLDPFTPTRL